MIHQDVCNYEVRARSETETRILLQSIVLSDLSPVMYYRWRSTFYLCIFTYGIRFLWQVRFVVIVYIDIFPIDVTVVY
jgi:hypothetical protein